MKKAMKITLIAVCSLAALALIAFLTFGGLPAKKSAARDFAFVDLTISDYPYADLQVPEDYVSLEKSGLTLMIPPELHVKDDSDPESLRSQLYFTEDDNRWSVIVQEPYNFGALELASPENELTDSLLRDFTDSINMPPVEDWYSFYDLIYHMDLDDCNIHSFRQANTFYALAAIKEAVLPSFEECWAWHPADGDGFIQVLRTPEIEGAERYGIVAKQFAPNDRNVSHDVLISAPTLEECCAIANSIRIAQ